MRGIWINDTWYESISLASRESGITVARIQYALRKGQTEVGGRRIRRGEAPVEIPPSPIAPPESPREPDPEPSKVIGIPLLARVSTHRLGTYRGQRV